ncbi:MAG: response regulator transcription factor [Thermodesulfobacteriota bacterium]
MAENRHSGKKILIIEDDRHIAEGVGLNLSLQGYETKIADTGPAGLEAWREWAPDLIVLDVMLPGMDGISVLRRIRTENEKLPILILSAKTSAEDRVIGLSHGVDDYMVKPFVLEELLLRVDRLLTRISWNGAGLPKQAEDSGEIGNLLSFGPNTIDLETGEAVCMAGQLRLTDQELKLLSVFAENPGKALPRKLLLEVGWGYSRFTSTRTVDNFIVRLRKYFEPESKQPRYFKSIRSKGYLFDPEGGE